MRSPVRHLRSVPDLDTMIFEARHALAHRDTRTAKERVKDYYAALKSGAPLPAAGLTEIRLVEQRISQLGRLAA